MYKKIFKFLNQFFKTNTLFKVLFNISPMYRRTNAKIISVSEDLHDIRIKINLNYKNRNYVGSMFGGSLFAATDPIYMTQLMQILGDKYVVWDKSSEIKFKKPAYETAFAHFGFSQQEISDIIERVTIENEINYIKTVLITNKEEVIFTEVQKILYISSKQFYKEKLQSRKKTNYVERNK